MQGTYIRRYLWHYTCAGSKDCQLQISRTPPYLLHNKQYLHMAQPRCICLFSKSQVYPSTHLHKISLSLSIGRYTPKVLSKEGNPNLNPNSDKLLTPATFSSSSTSHMISHFCHKIRNLQPLTFICRAPKPERFRRQAILRGMCAKFKLKKSNHLMKFACEVEARGSWDGDRCRWRCLLLMFLMSRWWATKTKSWWSGTESERGFPAKILAALNE